MRYLHLFAIFTFRCDIYLSIKSQEPEEFYIGSNPDEDEEQIVIPRRELRHLHDDIVGLSLVVANGWHVRVQPLKAPFDQVRKLTIGSIKCYVASFKKTPIVYSGYIDKFMFMRAIECQGDLFADHRDDEATFMNTYCLQEITVTANYNSRSGSLNDGDKGVPLRPDARPKSHHGELPDHPGITSDYPN